MPENPIKVNFDLEKTVTTSLVTTDGDSKGFDPNKTEDSFGGGNRTALQSRDTGLGDSIYPSTAQSRLSVSVDGDAMLGRRGSKRLSAYSVSSEMLKKVQANAHVKFADGMKKMRFFVRAYQAIKSSKDDSKKSHLDLGELAALLKGAQVDQMEPLQDEDEEQDEMKVFKTFNPRQYTFNAEYMWPYVGLEPVWRKPHERGIRDIRIIRGLMRGLHTYRKLPRLNQERVARVVRLERCTRGRTITRKGHVPENFFFIYAGKVNVSCFEDEESVYEASQVVAQLHKGDWFGGMSISRETGRELTVVAMEDCEFLVVDGEDFPDTGLQPLILQQLNTKLQHLRNHPFLSSLDDETIEALLVETKLLEAAHDSVIVRDSQKCNHIYLVCQGFCGVFRWMSSKLLSDPIEFGTMQKSVRADAVDTPRSRSAKPPKAKTKSSTPRRESLMTSSSDNILRKELAHIKESVGKLSIEYLTFPQVNVTRQEQFEYWQKSRNDRDVNREKRSANYKKDNGNFVKLETIGAGESFGLPEDLPTMPSMQLISCKSVLIEIPLSTFNRYLRPKVGPLISKSFLPFHALCESSTDKFNRLNCWESVKRSLTDDVRAQRFTPQMDPYDIYFLEGGAPPTVHAPSVKYSHSARQVHFFRPRHSLTNLDRLKLPSIHRSASNSRPATNHTLRSVRTASTRPVSRAPASYAVRNSRIR